MGIYLERPIDQVAQKIFDKYPEFNDNNFNIEEVHEGMVGYGNVNTVFRSRGFSVCSGIVLKNEITGIYGLIHLYPDQEIESLIENGIEKLSGSSAIIIEGSDARYKGELFKKISKNFDIEFRETKEFDTSLGLIRDRKFHVVYKPSRNIVMVARIAHKDVLIEDVFR